jgi:hypothetical protein
MILLAGRAAAAGPASWGETPFGHWEMDAAGLPAFIYTMDEFNDPRALYPTSSGLSNDHWHLLGNGRIIALAYNHGEVVVYSGERGAAWLNEREPRARRFAGGYGFLAEGDTVLSLRYPDRPEGCDFERRFGIGYFSKTLVCDGLRITQTVSAPAGEDTVLVSEIEIINLSERTRQLTWVEYWDVNPHYFGLMPELAPQGVESEGQGSDLASLTPLLTKTLKFIPGKFTLSRLVAAGLHAWRARATKDFRLEARKEGKGLVMLARAPQPWPAPEARAEVNFDPPAFFLMAMGETVTRFETRRDIAFDPQGHFRGRLGNNLIKDEPFKSARACLLIAKPIELGPRTAARAQFMAGYSFADGPLPLPPASPPTGGWKEILPQVQAGPDWLNREMLWHAYYLRALATYDQYFGRRTLSQGCAYQYMMGLNIAGRDPLQHLLPMVYLEPELARDVLAFTLSEMDPSGFIPYGIKGVGMRTAGGNPFPSDTNLYLMLALTEYVTATRDFSFLDEELPFYPREEGEKGTVMEHLRRAWRHQMEDVGIGANGLVKLRNSDWSDPFVVEAKVHDQDLDLALVEREAESVLNTAMAAYILPRLAGLVRTAGDPAWADQIETQAAAFKTALQKQYNGRWFNRAILPGNKVIGADQLFLEPQPWAILAGALAEAEESALDDTLFTELSSRSPLGALQRWPLSSSAAESPGMGTNGGVWFSLRYPLAMSYARQRPDYAWEEFLKMTNRAHAEAYPDIWIGQWSGPDTYNAPDSESPGWTYHTFPLSGFMMDFPIMCGHAHAGPWFTLLKLMGIHPEPEGFTIDPKIPPQTFALQTALLELEARPGRLRGALTPWGDSPITWRIAVPATPASVTKDGQATTWEMIGRFVVFSAPTTAGTRSEWEISWE